MNQETFFVSDSLKDRLDFNEAEEQETQQEEQVEPFLCEIIFEDTFLFLPIEEISFGKDNFVKFKTFDEINITKILREKVSAINFLVSNNTFYSLNLENIKNFGVKKYKNYFIVEIKF